MHADGKSTLASVSKWNSGKVNYINLFKELGERADEEHVDELVNAMSKRKVTIKYSNGKMYEFLVKRRKEFLTKLLKEGLSKSNAIDIMVSKKPDTVHTSTLKKWP